MDKFNEIINALSGITFVLTIVATIIVRCTPTTSDDEFLDDILKKVHGIMAMFPTWGVNPRTKKLEEKVEEQKFDGSSGNQ